MTINRHRILRLLAALAVVGTLVSCNGKGDEPGASASPTASIQRPDSPEAFAAAYCGAISDWLVATQDSAATDVGTSFGDDTELQKGLAKYLEAVTAATETLKATLEGLGAPDVEGGEEPHAAVLQALGVAETETADLKGRVDQVDLKGEDFDKTFQEYMALPLVAAEPVVAELRPIAEADPAFADDTTCKALIKFFADA